MSRETIWFFATEHQGAEHSTCARQTVDRFCSEAKDGTFSLAKSMKGSPLPLPLSVSVSVSFREAKCQKNAVLVKSINHHHLSEKNCGATTIFFKRKAFWRLTDRYFTQKESTAHWTPVLHCLRRFDVVQYVLLIVISRSK